MKNEKSQLRETKNTKRIPLKYSLRKGKKIFLLFVSLYTTNTARKHLYTHKHHGKLSTFMSPRPRWVM